MLCMIDNRHGASCIKRNASRRPPPSSSRRDANEHAADFAQWFCIPVILDN